MTIAPGPRATIGPYRVTGYLGAGGMGEVWRAQHGGLGRDVAIKRLSDAARSGVPLERFQREARLHATLNHPCIAQLYDYVEDAGTPCIVMELIEGPTIDDAVARGPMPVPAALTALVHIVEAVAYLHRNGILHRDIKPSNVKLRRDGTPVLLDFGIARAAGDPRLTRTGMIVGSPHAIAPEQFAGATFDERSDVWAIGVLAYEMLTGTAPFPGESVAAIASAVSHGTIVPPSRRNKAVPARLDAVVMQCLEREPAKRHQSAALLLAALRSLTTAPALSSARALPRIHVVTALAVAALLVVSGLAARRWFTSPPVPPAGRSVALDTTAQVTPAAAAAPSALVTRINVVEGAAAVLIDGRQVGTTPYEHFAPAGTSVTLVLRRAGFHDETVTFIVSDNQREYTLVLQRDPAAPISPAFIGLLGWWRRRRPATPAATRAAAAGPVTGERTLVPPLAFHAAARSDTGCVRSGNEDAVRIIPLDDGSVVAALCDGMGGHAAGEVASDIAISAIAERAASLDTADALVAVVDEANSRIRAAVANDPALTGMGTTCVVLRLAGHAALCAHVGDSRAYLVRDAAIYRLTEDHSHVRGLVRDGTIADQDARHHPDKNVILRALGPAAHVRATTWAAPLGLRPGDRFLLSSDGLHDLADDDELLPALALPDPDAACEALVAFARERGAPDNVSVCVVDARPAGAAMRTTRVPVAGA